MREWMVKLLGKNLTKWDRLKVATGVVSDEDMLSKLIHFFAEAKGIRLTEPQRPPPPTLTAGSRSVAVRVRPMKEAAAPSSFIVIHQNDPPPGEDAFPSTDLSDKSASPQQESRNSFPMLMLREEEDEEEDVKEEDDEDDCDPGEDSDDKEFQDIPIGRTKGVYYREQVDRPPLSSRTAFPQDEHNRVLDGMLWREAVLNKQSMPLEDVATIRTRQRHSLVTDGLLQGSITSGTRSSLVTPTLIPWVDPPPVNEFPSEAALLKEFGCTLCDHMGFSSRVEMITHFWLQHPETRERYPTQFLATKRHRDFAHCSLCMLIGSVAPAAKHNKLVPHMDRAHVACQRASERAPHVCDVCYVEIASEAERDEHVAAAHAGHEVKRYVCVVCARVERGEQAYIRHLRIHYTEFVYACNLCPNFRSRRPETMTAHTESHERRTFRCGRCPMLTRTFRTLVDHIRTHLEMPRHVCPVCGYRAYTSSRYFNHMDTHGGRLHRCDICAEEFTSAIKKSHHKIVVHRRPAKFTCDRCDITFKTSFRLKRHQASHTGYKPFKCGLCGKGLSSRQSVTNHTRICPENNELYRNGAIAAMVATCSGGDEAGGSVLSGLKVKRS